MAKHFLNLGHDVTQVTSHDLKSRIFFLDGAQAVQVYWNDKKKLNDICKDIDLIIYASGMNVKDCAKDPVGALNVNAVATANILQSAIKMNVKRFVYISTIHVYTDTLQGVVSESDYPTNLHPYAASHLAGENAVLWAQKNKLIDGIVVRISNGFGVPISKEVNCWMLLVNDLCRQAVEHKQLVLNSNGLQSRNFISISEICSAIDFLVCKLPFEKRVGNEGPINIGGENSLSLLETAKLIQSRCGTILGYVPNLLVQEKNNNEEISHLDFQIKKLKDLGYSYKHTLLEELDKLLIYCSNNFLKH